MEEQTQNPEEIISRALQKVRENPVEFMVPGITKYTENYLVLQELYDELVAKIDEKNIGLSRLAADKLGSVRRCLKVMKQCVEQAKEGAMYHSYDIDEILYDLAIAERQCFPKGYY